VFVVLPQWVLEFERALVELLRPGVLQGSCRVSRVFKLLFSLPAGPSLG
jgi:hypothetical protein